MAQLQRSGDSYAWYSHQYHNYHAQWPQPPYSSTATQGKTLSSAYHPQQPPFNYPGFHHPHASYTSPCYMYPSVPGYQQSWNNFVSPPNPKPPDIPFNGEGLFESGPNRVQISTKSSPTQLTKVGSPLVDEFGNMVKVHEKKMVQENISECLKELKELLASDLNDLKEKKWDSSKDDPDVDLLYGELGDTTLANNINEVHMKQIEDDDKNFTHQVFEEIPLSKLFQPLQGDGSVVDVASNTSGSTPKDLLEDVTEEIDKHYQEKMEFIDINEEEDKTIYGESDILDDVKNENDEIDTESSVDSKDDVEADKVDKGDDDDAMERETNGKVVQIESELADNKGESKHVNEANMLDDDDDVKPPSKENTNEASMDGDTINDDIDRIVAKGEEATNELDTKMKNFTEDAIPFKMDGNADSYDFDDDNKDVNKLDLRKVVSDNWNEPPSTNTYGVALTNCVEDKAMLGRLEKPQHELPQVEQTIRRPNLNATETFEVEATSDKEYGKGYGVDFGSTNDVEKLKMEKVNQNEDNGEVAGTGNIQHLKNETETVYSKEDKKATNMGEGLDHDQLSKKVSSSKLGCDVKTVSGSKKTTLDATKVESNFESIPKSDEASIDPDFHCRSQRNDAPNVFASMRTSKHQNIDDNILAIAAAIYGDARKCVEKEQDEFNTLLASQVLDPLRAMVSGSPLEDARHLAQRYSRMRQEAETQAAEVSRWQARVKEAQIPENVAKLQLWEAKMQELKANMVVLGKEATAALAAVESPQHRLTFQRLVVMVEGDLDAIDEWTRKCCDQYHSQHSRAKEHSNLKASSCSKSCGSSKVQQRELNNPQLVAEHLPSDLTINKEENDKDLLLEASETINENEVFITSKKVTAEKAIEDMMSNIFHRIDWYKIELDEAFVCFDILDDMDSDGQPFVHSIYKPVMSKMFLASSKLAEFCTWEVYHIQRPPENMRMR